MGGSPPARLVWLLAGTRLAGQVVETPSQQEVRSRLVVQASTEQQGAELVCRVEHEALSAPLQATATLDIQCKFPVPQFC